MDLPRGLIIRSNTGLPRAKKDVKCDSSLDPRSKTTVNQLETSSNGLYAF